MGIEPTLFAWEARVLPLNDTRRTWAIVDAECATSGLADCFATDGVRDSGCLHVPIGCLAVIARQQVRALALDPANAPLG